MSYLVFALGLLLAICGAASISFGYGIIDVERGWASVIGGAAALSGGIVTIALAMILHSLSGLRALLKAESVARARLSETPWQAETRAMEGAEPPAMTGASPHGATPLPTDDVGRAPDAEPLAPAAAAPAAAQPAVVASPRAEPAAARGAEASIEDVRRVVAETIKRTSERRVEIEAPPPAKEVEVDALSSLAPPPPIEPPPRPVEQAPRRRPAPFGLPRALDLKDIAPQHFGATRAQVAATRAAAPKAEQSEASAGSDRAASQPAAEGTPAAPAEASSPPTRLGADKPAASPPHRGDDRFNVIGRYESEGTSYVMFADGSIDARSALGAFHFSSMAELKAFMESQTRSDS